MNNRAKNSPAPSACDVWGSGNSGQVPTYLPQLDRLNCFKTSSNLALSDLRAAQRNQLIKIVSETYLKLLRNLGQTPLIELIQLIEAFPEPHFQATGQSPRGTADTTD